MSKTLWPTLPHEKQRIGIIISHKRRLPAESKALRNICIREFRRSEITKEQGLCCFKSCRLGYWTLCSAAVRRSLASLAICLNGYLLAIDVVSIEWKAKIEMYFGTSRGVENQIAGLWLPRVWQGLEKGRPITAIGWHVIGDGYGPTVIMDNAIFLMSGPFSVNYCIIYSISIVNGFVITRHESHMNRRVAIEQLQRFTINNILFLAISRFKPRVAFFTPLMFLKTNKKAWLYWIHSALNQYPRSSTSRMILCWSIVAPY